MKEMEIQGDIVERLGNQMKVSLHVDCVIDASPLFYDVITAGISFYLPCRAALRVALRVHLTNV